MIPNAIGHLQTDFINTKFYLMLEQQEFTENNKKKRPFNSSHQKSFFQKLQVSVIQGKGQEWWPNSNKSYQTR